MHFGEKFRLPVVRSVTSLINYCLAHRLNYDILTWIVILLACSEFDEKGILYWLGTAQGTKDEWSNPADDGHVAIELSHRTYNQASMKVNDVISRSQQSQVFYWGGSAPQWVSFNFGKISICVSSFTLRHGYNYNNSFPQDFLLQGSF
jgi:E3 ubiquitin-protein ligase HECTD1